MAWQTWNSNNYGFENRHNNKCIVYQLTDKNFPNDVNEFRKEIEKIFVVKETQFLQKKPGSSERYIEIYVSLAMTESEILNLGKRISIIEQKLINKCKGFYDSTVTKGITTQKLNLLNNIYNKLLTVTENKQDWHVVENILKDLIEVVKGIKTRTTKQTIIAKAEKSNYASETLNKFKQKDNSIGAILIANQENRKKYEK